MRTLSRMPCALSALVVILGLGSASCRSASVNVNQNYLTDQRFAAHPSTYPIEIITGQTARPHIVIGRVVAVEKEFWAGAYVAEGSKAIQAIKNKAREMGGDAITQFDSFTAPQGTVGQGSVTVQGTVIRWKDAD